MSEYTADRNNLQKYFLDETNVRKFIDLLHPRKPYHCIEFEPTVAFESSNWDVALIGVGYVNCECNWEETPDLKGCGCKYKDSEGDHFPNKYIKIQPKLGDDYPKVLQKMKKQIEKTNTDLEKAKKNKLKELEYDEKSMWYGPRENREEIRGIVSYKITGWNCEYRGQYILLIDKFETTHITKEEIKKMFETSHINIIIMEELNKPETIEEQKIRLINQKHNLEQEIRKIDLKLKNF